MADGTDDWLEFDFFPAGTELIAQGGRTGSLIVLKEGEVEVLRDLGFRDAWGIDLNPGPDNPFVRPGDFMHLDAPDNSLDLLYSNCVDHAFDLTGAIREHYTASDTVPTMYQSARSLAVSDAYAFIEIYADGHVVPIRPDGTPAF